jgi:hypothetical protein
MDDEERIIRLENKLNRVAEVVFNGYGDRIKNTEKISERLERKLNWLFVVFVGTLLALIGNLIIIM